MSLCKCGCVHVHSYVYTSVPLFDSNHFQIIYAYIFICVLSWFVQCHYKGNILRLPYNHFCIKPSSSKCPYGLCFYAQTLWDPCYRYYSEPPGASGLYVKLFWSLFILTGTFISSDMSGFITSCTHHTDLWHILILGRNTGGQNHSRLQQLQSCIRRARHITRAHIRFTCLYVIWKVGPVCQSWFSTQHVSLILNRFGLSQSYVIIL